jgi:hypothetical protein
MIEVLSLAQQQDWMPKVLKCLEEHKDLLDMPICLIENRILRNELFVFEVNWDLYTIGNVFTYGSDRVFFIYFLAGINLKKNMREMVNYAKYTLGCDKVDFHFDGAARNKLYERLFRDYEKQYRMYCKITL